MKNGKESIYEYEGSGFWKERNESVIEEGGGYSRKGYPDFGII